MNIRPRPLLFFALCLSAAPAPAGPELPAKAPVPPPLPAGTNPLSFFDGKLVLDVQERLRFEYRENNFDFNDGVDALTDDSWLLQRFRLGLKFKPTPFFTLYVQGQDIREFDSDRPNVVGALGAEGDDAFDLHQAWIEAGDPKNLSFKLGRQKLIYGDERLVGAGEWLNQARVFDAARLRYATEKWSIDLFTSSVVRNPDDKFNDSDWTDGEATRDQFFSGLYFSTSAIDVQTTDVYLLQLHEEYSVGDTDVWTLGTRLAGDPKKLNGWDYNVEMAGQLGEVRGKDLTAFAGHWAAGYNFESPWKPRVGVEYNYATGDSNTTDGDVGTFQNLFPTNHKFYGYMDVFSWQNMHNIGVSLSAVPAKNLKAQIDYHAFWLADTGDAWYRANGITAVRPIDSKAGNYAGSEIDLTLTWKATKNLALQAGYSHFFTGDYLSATGANDDADFAYAMMTVDF